MTKNGLRSQQNVLAQLQTYLPTLQLKKTLLQVEVNQSKIKLEKLIENFLNIQCKGFIDPSRIACRQPDGIFQRGSNLTIKTRWWVM